MKKVLVSLLSIALIGCSMPILNNTSQYSDLDKEYSQFTTKALTQSYLKKKMDKWLSDGKYSKNLVREIEYAKFKHKDLLKDIVALQPTMFDNITANTAVTTKRIESPFENYIEYINPYPSSVTANNATNITSSSFTANWTSASAATGYKLYIDGTPITLGNVTSYNKTGLLDASSHSYYVKATNSAGESSVSNTINLTLPSALPIASTATDATNITSTSFTANWNSVSGATSYKLFVNGSEVYSGANTSSNVTGLTAGSTPTYYVKAVNSAGESPNSNTISVNLNPAVPAIPTTLPATNIAQTSFTANWSPVSGATSYKLKIDSGAFTDVGNVTTYDISGLTAGSSHNYYVEASNISGTSASSMGRSVTLITLAAVATDATNIGSTSFTANWNPVSGATGYKIYLNGTPTTLGNVTTYNFNNLSASTNYSYYVKAINSGGESVASNTISLATLISKFTEIQSITTDGASDWESFTIGTDTYLVVSNLKNNSTYSINSVIYKWNTGTSQFDFFENIPTVGGSSFKFFSIDGSYYLASTNRNFAAWSLYSKIYKWNGSQFNTTPIQSIQTYGAVDSQFLTIGTSHYLVLANYYNDSSLSVNSVIYKWNSTTSQFDSFENIPTVGVSSFKFFNINSDYFLAVANMHGGTLNSPDFNTSTAKIYKWNGTQFDTTTPLKTIQTYGASDCDFFNIGTDYFLAIANSRNNSSNTVDSYIYKWNSSINNFDSTPYQLINTTSAYNLDFFNANGKNYLTIVSNYNVTTYQSTSKVYEWNGSQFTSSLNFYFTTYGAYDVEHFSIGSNNYIAVANRQDSDSNFVLGSKIYRID